MTVNPNPNQNQILKDWTHPSIKNDDLTAEQVQLRIEQYLGVPPPRVGTYLILVALDVPKEVDKFKNKEGVVTSILMPESTADKLKWSACTGMVVALGPDAYKDTHRFPSGPTCKLGDWVTIPRHEGVQIRYRGIIMHWLPDDKVALVIDDPSYVVRG